MGSFQICPLPCKWCLIRRSSASVHLKFRPPAEVIFHTELTDDLDTFVNIEETIDGDMAVWSSFILKHLNKHAPIKTKCVKTKRLPDWFTPDIMQMQKLRDNCKRLKEWAEYKT